MKPWMQRILIGSVVGLVTAGVVNGWNMMAMNSATTVRIEQSVKDISTDFDRFVDLRYTEDLRQINERMAGYQERLDRVVENGGG